MQGKGNAHQQVSRKGEPPPSDGLEVDSETQLDRWVSRRPVRTFVSMAFLAACLFVVVHSLTYAWSLSGFQIDSKATNYVGHLATTAVALAGALVSVMLARLALKLGREAKDAAERGNEIQDQMRRFDDPQLAETREGHKAAAALDLIGTLLCVYASEAKASHAADRLVKAIAHTYGRGNDLVSNPALYRYCGQLVGPGEAARRFAALQARLYEAARALGGNDRAHVARDAEHIAVEIALLSRTVESARQAVMEDPRHPLFQVALDLDWKNPRNAISGCESTARGHFERAMRAAESTPARREPVSTLDALVVPGGRIVLHILETDAKELEAKLDATPGVKVHESLLAYARACDGHEDTGEVADVVIARWPSLEADTPAAVAAKLLERPGDDLGHIPAAIESSSLWNMAIALANNPILERAVGAALQDARFLKSMRLEELSEHIHERRGIDPESGGDPAIEAETRVAAASARQLWRIRAAIDKLREIHDSRGAIPVPNTDPYARLRSPADEVGDGTDGDVAKAPRKAIVIVRPCFAQIDLTLPGTSGSAGDDWLTTYTRDYKAYRWAGEAA
jgi:hypothetical protein